jgi:hypothetical protein
MTRRAWRLAIAFALLPATASAQAQTINGTAEWTVTRGTNTSEDRPFDNNAFWQRYTLGYLFPILDPRLMKCDAEFTFRTSSLTFGGPDTPQEGHQRDIGYKLGASLFSRTRFPFFVQASRAALSESGDYPSSSGIRGGIVVPSGTPLPDFRTRNRSLAMGWQLTLPDAPRIEVGYRTGGSIMTGGPFRAEQNDDDLHAGVFWDRARTQQALRYQRTAFENLISQSFNQRLSELSYDLAVSLGARSRLTVRSGRRGSFSLFDVPSQIVDPGTGSYRLPSRGEVDALYAITVLNYEPARRLSIDLSGSADRQDAARVATSARLGSASARFDVFRGLSVSATGIYGTRGQMLGDVPVTVATRSAQAGATYRAGVRWLDGSIALTRGVGTNTTPEGRPGETASWSGQASLSSSLPWIGVGVGYDRAKSRDDILDFGNADNERTHASVTRQSGAMAWSGTWETSIVRRGRGATLASSRQQTFTATATYRLRSDVRLSANAGGFSQRAEFGRDRTAFYGGAFEAPLRRSLHVLIWLRRESTTATQTNLEQHALTGLGQMTYQLRAFSFSAEYRHYNQDLQYRHLTDPFVFRGHQLVLRVSRKFGLSW